MNYDIIGDVHGHADELEVLLRKLGYVLKNGVYKHPENRKVLFLGDFIDRGPQIRQVLHIARNMCKSGNAVAIIGNHEFNAIAFHTKNTIDGGFYRAHNFKEIKQHIDTLQQFQKFPDEWVDFLDWFRELPICVEIGGFRAVHACWDQKHVDWLAENFTTFTDKFIAIATDENHKAFQVVEELLKGKEEQLGNGVSFKDKDGNERFNARVKWWQPINKRKVHKDIMMHCPPGLADEPLPHNDYYNYEGEETVFFGHYWLTGDPELKNRKAICLDYSVAKEGVLVAYRSEYLAGDDNNKENGFIW